MVAECVETADLPTISYNSATFSQDGSGYAAGTVTCPNAGEVALTGGAEWNGTATNRELLASMPPSSTSAWYANGYNPESEALFVEVYCVSAANVPGADAGRDHSIAVGRVVRTDGQRARSVSASSTAARCRRRSRPIPV